MRFFSMWEFYYTGLSRWISPYKRIKGCPCAQLMKHCSIKSGCIDPRILKFRHQLEVSGQLYVVKLWIFRYLREYTCFSIALPAHSVTWPLIQFRNHLLQTIGLLGRVINLSQGLYPNTRQRKE
jgi:hypothetical protein